MSRQTSRPATSSVSTDGVGVAAGAVAGGLVVSEADKTSTVTASASPPAQDRVASLSLTAAEGGAVSADGISGAAAVNVAGDGDGSTAQDTLTVTAFIGAGVSIDESGSVSLTALANPQTSATATGVAGSLDIGLGASVALPRPIRPSTPMSATMCS